MGARTNHSGPNRREDGIGTESRRKRKEAERVKNRAISSVKTTAPSRGKSDGQGLHNHPINTPNTQKRFHNSALLEMMHDKKLKKTSENVQTVTDGVKLRVAPP